MGDRDVGDVVAGGDHVGAAGLRARRRRRACTVAGRARRSGAPSRATSAIVPAGQLGERRARARRARRTARPSRRARPCGRTGRRCRGRARRDDAPNASAERMHRADVARVADAPQRDAQRPDGRAPSAAGRRRARACRSRAGRRSASTCGATGMPSSPLPVGDVARVRRASRRRRRPPAGPHPRPRTRPACRASAFRRACGPP